MKTLILPVAGKSSRFPGMRPKWLLTMPDGKLMIEKAVELFNLQGFEKIVVVCLKEHLEDYLGTDKIKSIFSSFNHPNLDFCILEKATKSQSETVAHAIREKKIIGSIFIKDCDNTFLFDWHGGNEIAVLDLNKVSLIDAKSKSYVTADALGNVTNIVEKQVISNYFCCGGYGFSDAELFLRHYDSIKKDSEVYISHVVYSMLMSGVFFKIGESNRYIDWGTLREYRHYCNSFLTLFCDVDGVLLLNGSKFGKLGWQTLPIEENLLAIARLQNAGHLYLVITSSRPESEISYIEKSLSKFNIKPDKYVMGLPHTRRVLINDYSATNPYPTAISINLERDSRVLSTILESIER